MYWLCINDPHVSVWGTGVIVSEDEKGSLVFPPPPQTVCAAYCVFWAAGQVVALSWGSGF